MIISLPNGLLQQGEHRSYRYRFTKVKKLLFREKSFFLSIFIVIVSLFLVNSGCSSSPRFKRSSYGTSGQSRHFGTTATRNNSHGRSQTGMASYYGNGFHGKKTANGETYNRHELTAAHKKLPFNTRIKVTNLENNRSVVVRINDRGPFAKRRILDLSEGAAKKIDMIKSGVAKVRIEVLK